MPRLHLFELADQPWFPRTLADAGTAYLQALQDKAGVAVALAPLVRETLERSGARQIVDLCSGGGGPVRGLRDALAGDQPAPPVLLTDLQPNRHSLSHAARVDGVTLCDQPVDAAAVPAELTGLRTVFNALHHFRPDAARAVLADAQAAGQPILVVELSERTFLNVTLASALIPLFVLLVMPMVRPVRGAWLALTYLLPVLPWTIAWDGMVSHWRTYSLAEQQDLVAPLQRDGWTWEMGQVKAGPGRVTWLRGLPG